MGNDPKTGSGDGKEARKTNWHAVILYTLLAGAGIYLAATAYKQHKVHQEIAMKQAMKNKILRANEAAPVKFNVLF